MYKMCMCFFGSLGYTTQKHLKRDPLQACRTSSEGMISSFSLDPLVKHTPFMKREGPYLFRVILTFILFISWELRCSLCWLNSLFEIWVHKKSGNVIVSYQTIRIPCLKFEIFQLQVYFESDEVRACIVTCGGLCPGLNTVIREIVCGLEVMYNVKELIGIQVHACL